MGGKKKGKQCQAWSSTPPSTQEAVRFQASQGYIVETLSQRKNEKQKNPKLKLK